MSQLIHDFDQEPARRGSDARKYDPALCPPDVIPMWIADTDFKCPQPLIDQMAERVQQGHFGYPCNRREFSDAVAFWMSERFGWQAKSEWVEFAPGAILPLLYGMRALTAPGDGVLVLTPAYPPFYQLVENNGRRVVKSPLLLKDGRYEIDFEDLERGLCAPRTRVMLLCNPHNPTGRSFSEGELRRIGELCLRHHVFVLSDEIHSDIVYPGGRHIPFGLLGGALEQNCLIAVNPSKTFNTAGLRTAAFLCPNDNVRALVIEQRLNNKAFGRPIFGALACEVLYRECGYYADQLVEYLAENAAVVREALHDPRLPVRLIEPEATYLLWLDCRGMGLSQRELCAFFKEEAKLLLNDGLTFGPEGAGFMRLNIGCPRRTVQEAMRRLTAALRAFTSRQKEA